MDKYISKYSNDKEVSAAQYITELICENKAIKDKLDLHYRFWLNKKWAFYYKNQIASAHKLLTKYSAKAIILALRHSDARKIFSLRAPHLPAIIERMENELASQNTNLTIDFDRNLKTTFRANKQAKNIISKLKELE
jgi:hypothetical protein